LLTKHFSGTIAVFFVAAVLMVGGLISLPAMQTVEAAVNVGQTGTQTNTCGLIVVPVLCTNIQTNEVTVTPAVVATQDIDVTGTQNIDQANTCDDDDLGAPGEIECLNEASALTGLGNSFSLTHDQAADVSVESFEQDISQANACFLFDQCDNFGGNFFGIVAEDDDGILATDNDVEVGSSVQDVNQLNDCDGIFPPDPLCLNVGANAIGLSALDDGDVSLGESLQTVEQLNDCDNGTVACSNSELVPGFSNFLSVTSDGPDAEVNLDTNTQQASQGNVCAVDGTSCDNLASNFAGLTALDEAQIDLDDNTQTSQQGNVCDNNGLFPSDCDNSAFNAFDVDAADTSTVEGSNLQQKFQSNTCTDAICSNTGDNFNDIEASGESSVESDTSQKDIQSNTGTFVESVNTAGSSNAITATDSAEVDSDTEQSNTQINDCGFATDCFNTGGNTNVETASGDSELTTDNDQSNKQGNTCEDGFCDNTGSNSKDTSTEDEAEVDSESDQSNKQGNDCDGGTSDCDNGGSNNIEIHAVDEADVETDNDQSNDQNNDCDNGSDCDNSNDNNVDIDADNEDDVDVETDQESEQDNDCDNGGGCSNSGSNSVNIG
jgi:hypothetical protein